MRQHQQVEGQVQLRPAEAETGVGTQSVRRIALAHVLVARRLVAVDVEPERVGEHVLHVVRRGVGDADRRADRQFVVLNHARVHHRPHRHRHDRAQAQALHQQAVGDVDVLQRQISLARITLGEQGVGLGLHPVVQMPIAHHPVEGEPELVAHVHARHQHRAHRHAQVRLRQELRIGRVQAQVLVDHIARLPRSLRRRMRFQDALGQLVGHLRPPARDRGAQHELGQQLDQTHVQHPHLVLQHIVDQVLRVGAGQQRRDLRVHQRPQHLLRREHLADPPRRHVRPRVVVGLVQPVGQRLARVGRLQRLAVAEMVGAVHRVDRARRAVDLVDAAEVILRAQVHSPLAMRPLVRFQTGQHDQRLPERRAQLEDRAVLLRQRGEKRRQPARAHIAIEHQLAQRNRRDLLGQRSAAQHRRGDAVAHRVPDRVTDQVHAADQLDPLGERIVELIDVAQHIAGVGQRDDDHVARVGNLQGEDDPPHAGLDELHLLAVVVHGRLQGEVGDRPELTGMVFEDAALNQSVQAAREDLARLRRQTLDPVADIVRFRLSGDFGQDRVQQRIAGRHVIEQDQRVHVGVDPADQREFGQGRADHRAIQIPAGHLVEIARLLIEQGEDQLLGQRQRVNSARRRVRCDSHGSYSFPSLLWSLYDDAGKFLSRSQQCVCAAVFVVAST